MGAALAAEPTRNGYIRLGRFVPHDQVALTFLVSMPDGLRPAKTKVDHVDRKDVSAVAAELHRRWASSRPRSAPRW